MPPQHKNRKGCSQCGHCRTWRADKAFIRTTKANGFKKKKFKTCNRCSRRYMKSERLTEAEFRKKYRGSDHAEYAIHPPCPNHPSTEWPTDCHSSDPEEDDNEDDEDEDGEPDPPTNNGNNHDQDGGPGQGGVGQAVTVAYA